MALDFSNDVDLISVQVPGQTEVVTVQVPGVQGPAGSLTIGTVTTGAPGSQASATITGTSPNQVLNLTIPSGGSTVTSANITDATTIGRTVLTSADAAAVRTAIGAGTSNLTIGTTGTTAAAGNHGHTSSQISDATAAATANTLVMRNASGGASFGALTSASYQMGSDFAILPTAGSNSTASSFWGITLAGQRAANYTSASGVTMTGSSTTPHVYVPLSITTAPGLVIKAAASHTADLAQWQNSSSTVLAKVDAAGKLTAPTVFISGTQDTSVGAATRKDYVDAQVATRAAASHTHAISDLTATGTRDSTTYLRGDGTWAVPAGGGGGSVTAANITDATAIGRTVLTSVDAAAVRTAIGAGTSSLVIGTTSTTAKAGDYTPPADAAAGVASMRTLGTGALQAVAGNDARLSDARTPTTHTHTGAQITDATNAATPNMIVKRDAAGRAQVVDPAVAADIANKSYVDAVGTRVTNLESYNKVLVLASGAPVPAGTPANTVIFRTA